MIEERKKNIMIERKDDVTCLKFLNVKLMYYYKHAF